jgi:hypothetical protein
MELAALLTQPQGIAAAVASLFAIIAAVWYLRRRRQPDRQVLPAMPPGWDQLSERNQAGIKQEYLDCKAYGPPKPWTVMCCVHSYFETERPSFTQAGDFEARRNFFKVLVRYVEPGSNYTVAHQCAWHSGDYEPMITYIILGLGADPCAISSKGETPSTVAVRKGHASLASIFAAAAAVKTSGLVSSLYKEAKRGNFFQLSYTLGRGRDPTPVGEVKSVMILGFQDDHSGYTFLHQAAWHGNIEICKEIMEGGDNSVLNVSEVLNGRGETPAATAARKGHAECAAAINDFADGRRGIMEVDRRYESDGGERDRIPAITVGIPIVLISYRRMAGRQCSSLSISARACFSTEACL